MKYSLYHLHGLLSITFLETFNQNIKITQVYIRCGILIIFTKLAKNYNTSLNGKLQILQFQSNFAKYSNGIQI